VKLPHTSSAGVIFAWHHQVASAIPPATENVPPVTPNGSRPAMSSPEELTFVLGRWLGPVVAVLGLVRRIQAASISSREHPGTARIG
jgi:hypothetical protein